MSFLHDWTFTVSITVVSRLLILRDRTMGRLKSPARTPDPNLTLTPYKIKSGANTIAAQFVTSISCSPKAALLICHGIGETVEHWETAQRLLAANGVASLVFDYSGYGRSTGRITAPNCESDAIQSFEFLRQLLPAVPISLLGFSLGTGVAIAVAPRLAAQRLILCAAYTSLREAARSMGVPQQLTRILPDIWTNADSLKTSELPVLILHTEGDRLFSPHMAATLASGCSSPCELVVIPALTHNEPIFRPQLSFWSLLISRL